MWIQTISLFILCMMMWANTLQTAISHTKEEKQEKTIKQQNPFFLIPQFSPEQIEDIQKSSTLKTIRARQVELWLTGIENIEDVEKFVETIPDNVGVIVNPYNNITSHIIPHLQKRKCPIAMMIPTRSRLNIDHSLNGGLNHHKDSLSFLKNFVHSHDIQTVYVKDSIDFDFSLFTALKTFLESGSYHVLLPPQIFLNISQYLKEKYITHRALQCIIPESDNVVPILESQLQTCVTIARKSSDSKILFALTSTNQSRASLLFSSLAKLKAKYVRHDKKYAIDSLISKIKKTTNNKKNNKVKLK